MKASQRKYRLGLSRYTWRMVCQNDPTMELRQLRQAVMLAETLNFTRAAERLHMAQPPLSASIRKLEDELGVSLFDRLPSGVRVTPIGELVLRDARLALFHADQLRRTAKDGASGQQGSLRLGFTGSAAFELVPTLLQAFRLEYPQVVIEVFESTTVELLRRVESQATDVALVAYPVIDSTHVSVELLRYERLVVAVRSDSPLASKKSITLEDIAQEPLIIHSRTRAPHMHSVILLAFQQAGLQPNVVQEAVQVNAMLGLVEGGLGIAFVSSTVEGRVSKNITLLPLTEKSLHMNLGMGMAALNDAITPVARNFMNLARRLYPKT